MKTMDAKLSIRTYSDVKENVTEVYEKLGVDLTTAINVFLRKSIACNGFPFDVRNDVPNKSVMKAIENADKGRNLSRRYNNVHDLFKDLNKKDK